jgi:hypothetical protein
MVGGRGAQDLGVVAVSEWQPIETATEVKEKRTTILGWSRYMNEPATIRWDGRRWMAVWGGSEVIEHQSDFGTNYKDAEPIEFWQPLPEPPK